MSNEIKVGDKVRVREDAPRIYINGFDYTFVGAYSIVVDIEDDNAIIKIDNGAMKRALAIPTKYLVKVDAEKKEAKYKVGDKVKALFTDPIAGSVYCVGTIIGHDASDGTYHVQGIGGLMSWFGTDGLEPYTEQTEEKKLDGITEETANELSDMLEGYYNAMETIKDKSYWTAYTADLAKEIAVKVANKYNDPKETAEYAVSVAKAVVEGLKRK